MEMSSEKQEFSENNPFKEINPDVVSAIMWEKIHNVEEAAVITKEIVIENKTDIKWLKREYAVQIALTGGVILLLLKFGGII